MKVAISGGNGFVGTHLVPVLAARGDEVRLLVRSESAKSSADRRDPRVSRVRIDSPDALDGIDAIVNPCGRRACSTSDGTTRAFA